MVKRKKISLLLLSLLIIVVIPLLCSIFYIINCFNQSFIYLISISIFILLSYLFLIIAFSFYRIFSDIKNELKILKKKEKAVKDIFMYDQFLNPPDIDN
jgi:amino acid transporter